MAERNKRLTVERRNKILSLLTENGHVFINELSKLFNVSEVTIRNDLEQLESKNLLIRARGGAMSHHNIVGLDFKISEKHNINIDKKKRIGKKAAELIKDYETIIFDSGTTTQEVAKHISGFKGLNVITNAINIINQLVKAENINLIVAGGILRKNSLSLIGPIAEQCYKNFYVDKAFVAVDGFDVNHGAYTPNIEEAYLNKVIISIAKEIILVTDSSKFKRKSMAFICEPQRFTTIVTDSEIDSTVKMKLEDYGIKVIIA